MLRVYGRYKYFNSSSAGTVFVCDRCQILTYIDGPSPERINIFFFCEQAGFVRETFQGIILTLTSYIFVIFTNIREQMGNRL